MHTFRKVPILFLLLLIPAMIFALGSQEAQDAESQGATRPGVEQGTAQAEPAEPAVEPSGEVAAEEEMQAADDPNFRRLSELVGHEVANEAGDVNGNVDDAVLTTNGDITHLVVSLAADTGAAGVPPDAAGTPADQTGAAPATGADTTVPPADQGAAPADQGAAAVAEPARDQYLVPIDNFTFGGAEDAITMQASMSDLEGYSRLADGRLPAEIAGAETAADTQHILADQQLKGFNVRNAQDQDLGGINDIMLDLQGRKVAYLGLGAGGFLGIGEKVYAVPMEAVTDLNLEEERLLVNITEEQLRQNPGIEGDNWPNQAADWTPGAMEEAPATTEGADSTAQ